MSDELLMNPQYWRDRAEEARAMAVGFIDKLAQDTTYQIARGYDEMAELAKRRKDKARGARSN